MVPLHEYVARNPEKGCDLCKRPFEHLDRTAEEVLRRCPRCGAPVRKLISPPNVAAGKGDLDRRARAAGFHKLRRVDKGTYEKEY